VTALLFYAEFTPVSPRIYPSTPTRVLYWL